MSDPDPAGNPIGAILLAIVLFILHGLLVAGAESFDALGDARVRELEER